MRTLKRIWITAMTVGLMAAVPISALAQPMMGPGMGYGNMGRGMMGGYGPGYGMGPGMMGGYCPDCGVGPGMMGPGMMGVPYGDVDLTDEQSAKIGAIREEASKKQWDVMNQLQDEQFKLQQFYAAATRDNTAINEAFRKLGQLRQQMWDNMTDTRKKIDAVLTKEQRDAARRRSGRYMMWGW